MSILERRLHFCAWCGSDTDDYCHRCGEEICRQHTIDHHCFICAPFYKEDRNELFKEAKEVRWGYGKKARRGRKRKFKEKASKGIPEETQGKKSTKPASSGKRVELEVRDYLVAEKYGIVEFPWSKRKLAEEKKHQDVLRRFDGRRREFGSDGGAGPAPLEAH